MIDELIKVDPIWFRDFVLGKEGGLKGWFSTLALIFISFGFKGLQAKIAEMNVSIIRLDKTMEENTDALIESNKDAGK